MITLTATINVSEDKIISINSQNLKSLSINFSDREDADAPSFGIISNTGKLSFYDVEGEVLNLIQQVLLGKSNKIEAFINNTLTKNQNSIGVFYSDKWTYDNNSRLISATVKDDLQEWQTIIMPQSPALNNFTYLELYYWLRIYTPSKFNIVVSEDILTYLSNITESEQCRLKGNTLWSLWQQFCEATMLHIYKNSKGETVISNHK